MMHVQKYVRHKLYPVDEIFPLFEGQGKKKVEFDGVIVSRRSQRYALFAKSVTCATCGLKGTHFAAERMASSESYHFNLYAVNENGDEILMTKDHIVPKSKGGSNTLDNYQTMCYVCNQEKDDKVFVIKDTDIEVQPNTYISKAVSELASGLK